MGLVDGYFLLIDKNIMKICDVVMNSIWYDPRVRKQIISYKNAGFDLECVGIMDSRYEDQAFAKIPCIANLAVMHKNQYRKRNYFTRFISFINIIRQINRVSKLIVKTAPDIIHANDLDALVPAYKASKKLKCKLIYDSHEICLENNYIHNNRLLKLFYSYYEKKIIKKVDKVICVSHAAAEYLADFYNIPEPMVVTNCCISKEITISENKNNGFEVLNHGQFYAGRGYDVMVETAPLLSDYPDVKLALRGFGVMEEQLRNRVKELEVKNVVFYPKVRVEELISSASLSMVGIALTEKTCLNFTLSVSNKIFEYAAAGIPVIMSDIPEHRYLNNKYHFGIVLKNDNPEDLFNAIIELYCNKEFYRQCRDNAIAMTQELNWEKDFDKLIIFEKSIIK